MATASKTKPETEHAERKNGRHTDPVAETPEVSPTLAQAFQTLREAASGSDPIETMGVGTKLIKALEEAGALKVTEKRRQGKGYAPTHVQLLVERVQGNPDLEPRTRAKRGTATRGKAAAPVSTDQQLPTVEDMQKLIAAIEKAEVDARKEVSKEAQDKVDGTWSALAKLKPGTEEFTNALEAFNAANTDLGQTSREARKNAFAAVKTQAEYSSVAKYLRLLSDRKGDETAA